MRGLHPVAPGGLLLIGVTLLAIAFVAVSLWLFRRRRLRLRSWLGAFALVAWVVGVGVKVHFDRVREARVDTRIAALPSIAWPGSAPEASAPQDGAPTSASADASQPVQAAPISSLIGGLERRLKSNPDDAAGWALLAQSYAFMGDAAAADAAVRKAIARGVDEQELRARIDDAMRGAQSR
jgi:cytochrome c-type biogenesis protein CcmH/NrfG